MPLGNYDVAPEILVSVPFKLINIYSVLPIDKMGRVLSVAMADPLNDGVVDMLKEITSCDISVFISTYSEIRHAINKYFTQEVRKDAEEEKIEEVGLLRADILRPFIQVKGYDGRERRKYRRVDVDLEMVYFFQNKTYEARVKNVSYGGILFISHSVLPINQHIYTNIACKIFLGQIVINAVVQIVRVERIDRAEEARLSKVPGCDYSIAGFFVFMTEEVKKSLAVFLKERLEVEEGNKEIRHRIGGRGGEIRKTEDKITKIKPSKRRSPRLKHGALREGGVKRKA
jgi:hypothetical protein